MNKDLYDAVRALRAFSPLPKEVLELVVIELTTASRIGMKMQLHVNPEKGYHNVTVEVFPEASDEQGSSTDKIWNDTVVHSFTFTIEAGELALLFKLKIENRVRRSAFCYARWAARNNVTEVMTLKSELALSAGEGPEHEGQDYAAHQDESPSSSVGTIYGASMGRVPKPGDSN